MTATPNASSAEAANGAPRQQASDAGFVLVFVLGMLAILALVATLLMTRAHLNAKARRALNAGMELTAVADGITRLVAYRLGEQRNGARLPVAIAVDGRLLACRQGDVQVAIRVQDQAGLIDLNAAPSGLLAVLAAKAGAAAPDRLAAAIVDFRDADDVAQVGGAERLEYQRAGLTHGPKNAPFEAVDELDQVLGMTPAVLARLRPWVTVYGTADPDPGVVPSNVRVLLSLPPQGQAPTGTAIRAGSRGRSRVFGVSVAVRRTGDAAGRMAIVDYNEQASTGFVVRDWSILSEAILAQESGTLPCEQL